MSKKNKIEILVEDDDLSAIDDALDAAVDNLVGVNERIRDLLDSIEPPPPHNEGEAEGSTAPASEAEPSGSTPQARSETGKDEDENGSETGGA